MKSPGYSQRDLFNRAILNMTFAHSQGHNLSNYFDIYGPPRLDHLIGRVTELPRMASEEVISQTQLARRLPLNQPALSNAVKREARLVRDRQYSIDPEK